VLGRNLCKYPHDICTPLSAWDYGLPVVINSGWTVDSARGSLKDNAWNADPSFFLDDPLWVGSSPTAG